MVVSSAASLSCSDYGDFIRDLKQEMEQEFELLNTSPQDLTQENYLVYKNAFSRIGEHSRVYHTLLVEIQKEYDGQITQAKKLCNEDNHAKGDTAGDLEETLANLVSRKKQLDQIITLLNTDNADLTHSIQSVRELVADASSHSLLDQESDTLNTVLKGLTLEQMTNVNLLSRELGKLQNEKTYLLEVQSTEFVSKDKFNDARAHLLDKEDRKDLLHEQILALHQTNPALRILIDTLNNMTGSTFEDILSAAQTALQTPLDSSGHLIDIFDDEDPVKEKEAEMILAYVEHFEELVRDGSYSAAAVHAANSPNGILRTMTTMQEFKELPAGGDGYSPWLQYCTTLMSTVKEFGLPAEEECVECVECALKEGRTDCIAQWIANNTLQMSRIVGERLLCHCSCRARCTCSCGPLAQEVFRALGDDDQLMYCMARQGALYRALHHAKAANVSDDQLLSLLVRTPSVELATLLVMEHGLYLGKVLQSLHGNHHDNISVGVIRTLNDEGVLSQTLLCDNSGDDIEWRGILEVCCELGEETGGQELRAFILNREAYGRAVIQLGSEPKSADNSDPPAPIVERLVSEALGSVTTPLVTEALGSVTTPSNSDATPTPPFISVSPLTAAREADTVD